MPVADHLVDRGTQRLGGSRCSPAARGSRHGRCRGLGGTPRPARRWSPRGVRRRRPRPAPARPPGRRPAIRAISCSVLGRALPRSVGRPCPVGDVRRAGDRLGHRPARRHPAGPHPVGLLGAAGLLGGGPLRVEVRPVGGSACTAGRLPHQHRSLADRTGAVMAPSLPRRASASGLPRAGTYPSAVTKQASSRSTCPASSHTRRCRQLGQGQVQAPRPPAPRPGAPPRSRRAPRAARRAPARTGAGRPGAGGRRRPAPGGPAPGPSATSTVRLPSRRSSPAGLPVSAGSPNTPSRSSRSWNASPSGSPNRLYACIRPGSAPASAAPSSSGRSTVYFALLNRATRSARCTEPPPRACSSRSRYCPPISSDRIAANIWSPRASASGPEAADREHLVGPDQAQVTEQDRRAGPERLRVAQPLLAAVQRGEPAVCRGRPPPGVRCRPSRRRARSRRPGTAPAPSPR